MITTLFQIIVQPPPPRPPQADGSTVIATRTVPAPPKKNERTTKMRRHTPDIPLSGPLPIHETPEYRTQIPKKISWLAFHVLTCMGHKNKTRHSLHTYVVATRSVLVTLPTHTSKRSDDEKQLLNLNHLGMYRTCVRPTRHLGSPPQNEDTRTSSPGTIKLTRQPVLLYR